MQFFDVIDPGYLIYSVSIRSTLNLESKSLIVVFVCSVDYISFLAKRACGGLVATVCDIYNFDVASALFARRYDL